MRKHFSTRLHSSLNSMAHTEEENIEKKKLNDVLNSINDDERLNGAATLLTATLSRMTLDLMTSSMKSI